MVDICYCPVLKHQDVCEMVPVARKSLEFGNVADSDAQSDVGQAFYTLAVMAMFGLVLFVLMKKIMVTDQSERELDNILAAMRNREFEEKQSRDRVALLHTKRKILRWLRHQNAPKRQKITNRKKSIADILVSAIPDRMKNRRATIAYLPPEIVVTDEPELVRGQVVKFHQSEAPLKESPFQKGIEIRHCLSTQRSIDSQCSSRSRSPGSMSLQFDFDVSSISSAESTFEVDSSSQPEPPKMNLAEYLLNKRRKCAKKIVKIAEEI